VSQTLALLGVARNARVMPPRSDARKVASTDQTRIEAAIVALGGRQHRQVSTAQLLALGLGAGAIKVRTRNGRLHRVHQGVHSLGGPPVTDLERASAALLACGESAELSHATAVALLGYGRWPFLPELSVPSDRGRAGMVVHRLTVPLHPRDVRRRHGLRVTSPERTALDMAARLDARELTRLVDDMLHGELTRGKLAQVIARYPRHPGAHALQPHAEAARNPSRSDFELEFLAFCAEHDLPAPLLNVPVLGREADAFFPAERVVVECDGWRFHRDRATFESDRDRDADRLVADILTVRVTKRRLRITPEREAQRLRQILARRRQVA
jgi:hypothetical protein